MCNKKCLKCEKAFCEEEFSYIDEDKLLKSIELQEYRTTKNDKSKL